MKMQIRGLGQLHYLHMELSLLQRKTYIYSEMFPVKKMLGICCGSGHSLKYHADRNAAELWGVDLSHKQIENAQVCFFRR